MKLWKTLLPVATLGATAACVVPMATACSSKTYFSTSDVNFKPDKQYKDGAETTIATTADAEALNTAYFADGMTYVKDFLYSEVVQPVQAMIEKAEESLKKGDIESYDIHYTFDVNSYSLTEKELDLGTPFNKVKGYILNTAINSNIYASETSKDETIKIKMTQINETEIKATLSNFFIMVNPYTIQTGESEYIYPGVLVLGHKDMDWAISTTETSKTKGIVTFYETGKSTTVYDDTESETSGLNKDVYGEELYDPDVAGIDAGDSYFMEKVTFTIPTPTTK